MYKKMGLTLDTDSFSTISTWESSFEYLNQFYKTEKSKDKNSSNLIYKTFEYRKEAGSVLLTGSFCNWTYNYYLSLTKTGIFSITIEIPEGENEFIFIVDGKEKISEHYPNKIDNNGKKINYIIAKNEIEVEKENENKKNKNNGYSNKIEGDLDKKLGITKRLPVYYKDHFIKNHNPNKLLLIGEYTPNIILNHLSRPQVYKNFSKLFCKIRVDAKVIEFVYYTPNGKNKI